MNRFRAKKVAVLGLGVEGLDLCQYLTKKGARITGFDQKTAAEFDETYQKLQKLGLQFSLGPKYLDQELGDFDFIFRSPGVKPNLPALKKARQAKIPVSSATRLFFDLCPGKILGVTGTKGKGTTATLIYRILKASGQKAFLLGNIGQPCLGALPQIDKNSWVVFELSSFQLLDLKKSPYLAVVLFITSEHLDYHRTPQEYLQAKLPIVKYQSPADLAVFNADDPNSSSFAAKTKAQVYFFSRLTPTTGAYIKNEKEIVLSLNGQEIVLGETKNLRLLGKHNWENVTAAAISAHLAGAHPQAIKKIIFSFSGLPHRLELVTQAKGVKYYNDSFSTTPETAVAALRSFHQPIILIAGGSEKGSDFSRLGQEIAKNPVKTLILIGQMAPRIKKAAQKAGFKGQIVSNLKSMKAIVQKAAQIAAAGDIVLLSPACASFDLFENYQDRGNQFKKYAQKL